jgi:hypothetical protein
MKRGSNQYARRPKPPVLLAGQPELAAQAAAPPTREQWWAALVRDRRAALWWTAALDKVGLGVPRIARVPIAAARRHGAGPYGGAVVLVGLFQLDDGSWALLDVDVPAGSRDALRWELGRAELYTAPSLLELVRSPQVQTEASAGAFVAIAGDRGMPPEVLQGLTEYRPDQLYAGMLGDRERAFQLRRQMWSGEVLRTLAGNPSCPVPALLSILEGDDRQAAAIAAGNPALPRAVLAMYQLAGQ